MNDLLNSEKIEALPKPLYVTEDGETWRIVKYIELSAGYVLVADDTEGNSDGAVLDFCHVTKIKDGDGDEHSPQQFYSKAARRAE